MVVLPAARPSCCRLHFGEVMRWRRRRRLHTPAKLKANNGPPVRRRTARTPDTFVLRLSTFRFAHHGDLQSGARQRFKDELDAPERTRRIPGQNSAVVEVIEHADEQDASSAASAVERIEALPTTRRGVPLPGLCAGREDFAQPCRLHGLREKDRRRPIASKTINRSPSAVRFAQSSKIMSSSGPVGPPHGEFSFDRFVHGVGYQLHLCSPLVISS